jgi:hypothetical protein
LIPPDTETDLIRPTGGDYLLIQKQGEADYTHELKKAVVVIGRSQTCDIVLDAPGVSRQHARLERTTTGWQISDLGSSNGTWVKDSQLLPNIPERWEPGRWPALALTLSAGSRGERPYSHLPLP